MMEEVEINKVKVDIEEIELSVQKWTKKVKQMRKFEIKSEVLEKMRKEAELTLQNDIVDFRSLKWSYLIDLWSEIKSGRRFQHIELVTFVNIKGERVTCRRLEQSTREHLTLLTSNGTTIQKTSRECRTKSPTQWTIFDFSFYVISAIITETEVKGNKSFIDTTFNTNIGNSFEGSFVVAPNDSNFDVLMTALKRYFSKKQRLLSTREEEYVWLYAFTQKKNFVFTNLRRNSSTNNCNEAKSAIFDYTTKIIPKMVDLFDERLVFLDSWTSPSCLQFAWCLWEIFACISCCKGFAFIYDEITSKNFYTLLIGTEDLKINTNMFIPDLYKFDSSNVFQTIGFIEPSLFKSNDYFVKEIIIKAFATLPNGFTTFIQLLKRDICKQIAIKYDNDVHFIVKEELMKIVQKDAKKLTNFCNKLRQIAIFMRNINEPTASASYLRQALKIFDNCDTNDEKLQFKFNESKALCHLSLARTLRALKLYKQGLNELEKTSEFIKTSPLGEQVFKEVSSEITFLSSGLLASSGKYVEALTQYEDCLDSLQKMGNDMVSAVNKKVNRKNTRQRKLKSIIEFEAFSSRKQDEGYSVVLYRKLRVQLLIGYLYKDKLFKLKEAELMFYRALENIKELDVLHILECAKIYIGLASIKIENGDFKGAVRNISRAIPIIQEELGESNNFLIKALDLRAFCCRKLGDITQAQNDEENKQIIKTNLFGKVKQNKNNENITSDSANIEV